MHILHCLLTKLSPKCVHYPQNAYISIVFDEKYPLIAYIILELKFKYPLIAYIILGLKKVQNIFKPDNNTERKIRDRGQVAVFGGRKQKVCRRLKTIDAISRQKIDIRVGMVPVL